MKYLPIAESIVLSFFTPLLTAYVCHVTLSTPFTTRQLLGGLISLLGVVLIARPISLFTSDPDSNETDVPASKRLISIILGLTSCLGSATVYTIIRVISHRAHALITVNWYALISTIASFLLIVFLPSVSFSIPSSPREYFLLVSLGIYGFFLQFLMTKGLQLEKGARGTNVMCRSKYP